MKLFTLLLAVIALAVPATLLMTSTSNAGLLTDRDSHAGPGKAAAHAPRDYARR